MALKTIYEIAKKINIDEKYIEPYGKYKAKISLDYFLTLRIIQMAN